MCKNHLADPVDAARTRCGYPVASIAWSAARGHRLPIAEHPSGANCVNCLRALRDAIAAGDELEPFERGPAHEPVYGTRELGRVGQQAIERTSQEGEAAPRGWPSADAAVRSYVRARAEGASLRSTSDPDRANRVQSSRDASLGGREHATVERHRTVAVALSRAELDVEELADACPLLTPAQAREVYLLRVVGMPHWVPTRVAGRNQKGRWLDWIGHTDESVVERVDADLAVQITELHVERIARHFSAVVRDALIASGEMRVRAPIEREPRERARTWDPLARLREASRG